MNELRLPRLMGTRPTVQALFGRLDRSAPHGDEGLILVCRNLASVSPSAVDEIVEQALRVYGYGKLILVSPPDTFADRIKSAAERRGMGDLVKVETAYALGI